MVRAGLAGDAHAALLAAADQLDAAGRRDVQDVQPAAGQLGQRDVAVDHDLLGRRRHAAQAQPHALEALVHDAAARSARGPRQWLSTALSNIRQYSRARRMISALTTGEPSSVKATAPPSTSPPISASSSPLRPLVTAPIGKTLALPARSAWRKTNSAAAWLSSGRLGVGHAGDRGDAAGQRRRGAGGDRLVLLAARLAQVDVHVDQAGADDLAGGVDGAVGVQPRLRPDAERSCSPRIQRSATWSMPCDGSMTRPLVMRRVFIISSIIEDKSLPESWYMNAIPNSTGAMAGTRFATPFVGRARSGCGRGPKSYRGFTMFRLQVLAVSFAALVFMCRWGGPATMTTS